MSEQVYSPTHYTGGKVETIEKVLSVIEGLPAEPAYLLGQIIRYCDRCDAKHDDPMQDLAKANNYAHKLITGEWRHEDKSRHDGSGQSEDRSRDGVRLSRNEKLLNDAVRLAGHDVLSVRRLSACLSSYSPDCEAFEGV